MNKGLATVCLSVLAFLAANAQTVRTLYIDPISNNGPANWNNLSFVGTGTVLLKDSLTNATAVRATVTVPLVGSNANTATSPTGDAEEFTPAGANSVYGNNTKPYGEVVFSNLYANVAYTFTFYASRVGVSDVRTALYTVTGANSGSVTLDAANNSTQVATVSDIYPRADGTLTLRIAEGAGNTPHLYYLTAMKIAYTEPPPTVVYVDSAGTSAATGWNLLPMNDNSDVALAATNGDSSGLRAQVTTPLSSSLSTAGTDNPIGDAAEFAPAGREACYGASDGYMKLYYLKPDVAYTFTFYASRLTYTSQRATRYTVTGLNSASNVLEAAGNTQDVAVVSGILPAADGTVTIHLSRPAGSSYNFLTAFKITYVDNGLPSPEPADIPGKRVLFFGNPYTSTKDAPEIFSRLAGLGGYPRAFVVADTAADRTLANHIARVDQYPGFNVGHPTLTGTNTWDYVVIQGHGDESSALGDATAFRTNALALFRRVKNHASGKGAGAKAVLFQTWARGTGSAVYPGTFASPEAMQAEINANTAVATNNIAVAEGPENVLLAPVGEAFAKGGFDAATLYAANLSDPTNAGPELVALVLYKTLYGGLAMAFEYDAAFSAGVTTLAETNWLRATHWADGLSVPVAQRPPTGSKETLLLDAAGNGANTPVYLGWNYRSFNSLGSVPLVLTNGYPTSATCQVLTRMDAVTTSSTATPTGDAAIFARSLANNVYGHINPFGNSYSNETCEVRFGGLNRNQAYTFTFYASRIGATGRETRYITTGANSAFTDLEPGNNSTQVATVSGIRPKADGTIDLTVTAGPNNTSAEKFYHLNALMIETSRSGLLISVQ